MFIEADYMKYCRYFQAQIDRSRIWFFTATLRSFEHLCFDRTLDKQKSIFEFFVPEENVQKFMGLMHWYQTHSYVSYVQELPNRLASPDSAL